MDRKNDFKRAIKLKEYHRKWKKDNPEKVKTYRKKNIEKRKKYNREYYRKNRDEILGRQKKCWKKYREKYNKLAIIRHHKKIKWINDYKLSKGCAICGYNKCAAALEFHHKGDKEFNISLATAGNRSVKKIKEEMDKCIVLCANCHRELHNGEKNV